MKKKKLYMTPDCDSLEFRYNAAITLSDDGGMSEGGELVPLDDDILLDVPDIMDIPF